MAFSTHRGHSLKAALAGVVKLVESAPVASRDTVVAAVPARDWREPFLEIAIATGVALVVLTEGLSAFGLVTRGPVAVFWAAWCAVLAFVLVRRLRRNLFVALSPGARVLLVGLAALIVLLGVVAAFAPPNTSDSLSYHMSRVANWQQPQSVHHCAQSAPVECGAVQPAGFLPQLFHPPLAEFAILNMQVIAGSDRFANFVQWLSMIGSAVVVSFIARLLGASRNGQVLAAVFAATIPVGVLEATGSQSDYVATFWLACFVASVLLVRIESARASWRLYLTTGAALGLALMAKGTNYFYAPAFGLLVFTHLRALTLRRLMLLGSVALIALSFIFVHFANYDVFGAPLGPGVNEGVNTGYVVDAITLNGFASNVLRNLALHLSTPDIDLNHTIYDDVLAAHQWLGIPPNSPITTFGGDYPQSAVNLEMLDGRAGNLLALLLLVLTLFAAWANGQLWKHQRLLLYIAAWGASFLVFCLLVKWQLWHARLHLAWFVLGAPVVGVVWSQPVSRLVWRGLIAVLLLGVALRAYGGVQSSPRRLLAVLAVAAVVALAVGALEKRTAWWVHFRHFLAKHYLKAERRLGEVAWLPLGALLLISAWPWVAFNEIRPLLGPSSVLVVPRTDQYFVNAPEEEAPYVWAADVISSQSCSRVGLLVGPDVWDYPMWVLLRERLPNVVIRNVYVPNISARLSGPTFVPCGVVALWPVPGDAVQVDGVSFRRVERPPALDSSDPSIAVFVP